MLKLPPRPLPCKLAPQNLPWSSRNWSLVDSNGGCQSQALPLLVLTLKTTCLSILCCETAITGYESSFTQSTHNSLLYAEWLKFLLRRTQCFISSCSVFRINSNVKHLSTVLWWCDTISQNCVFDLKTWQGFISRHYNLRCLPSLNGKKVSLQVNRFLNKDANLDGDLEFLLLVCSTFSSQDLL